MRLGIIYTNDIIISHIRDILKSRGMDMCGVGFLSIEGRKIKNLDSVAPSECVQLFVVVFGMDFKELSSIPLSDILPVSLRRVGWWSRFFGRFLSR